MMVSAGMGATRPADDTAAAAEAEVWFRLHSRMVNCRAPATWSPFHSAKPSSAAVTLMFMPQPIFSPA